MTSSSSPPANYPTPTDSRSKNPDPADRTLAILLGYNTPLVLWTLYALIRTTDFAGGWRCPIDTLFSTCPGCGLTTAYASLLQGQPPNHVWFYVVWFILLANSAWSIRRAVSLSAHALPRD